MTDILVPWNYLVAISVPEPGAVEPPYFAGAGAGAEILVKNGSSSELDK